MYIGNSTANMQHLLIHSTKVDPYHKIELCKQLLPMCVSSQEAVYSFVLSNQSISVSSLTVRGVQLSGPGKTV